MIRAAEAFICAPVFGCRQTLITDSAFGLLIRTIRVICVIRGFCPPPAAPESRDCGTKTGGFCPQKKVKIYY